jgi:7,8-dihydropterin-6-yl-methyl-4-(beta-D-ribofuranosyl)aminobenzene 5'-phosphate synthase
MAQLAAVDSVEVQVIVDNVTDSLSSVPMFVETEFASLTRRRRGQWVMAGNCLCCAAHGLSCLITLRRGDATRTLLFDTGPEDQVFAQNAARLGLDLGPVEAIVLSHGHWDHGGAMLRALQMIRDRNGGREVACHTHPDMFRTRAIKLPDGTLRPMEDVPSVEALRAQGARVVDTREPQLPLDAMAYVSGEIPRVTPFEVGIVGQHRRTLDGTGWEPDELVMDERFVAVNVAGKGLVVFTACSHAGVVNVLTHARACFPGVTLHAVVGGLHLSGTNERIIGQTVEAMRGSISLSSRPATAPAGAR